MFSTITTITVLVILTTTAVNASGENINRQLETVIVMYRHGDRTPIDMYPTDPYKDPSNWLVDFGQLTPRGKRMHFELGKYLRTRYNGFLSETYNENDIYVRSTDVDRTLMSAMSNLAGLYPPKSNQIWNKDLMWQPIPVHTRPLDDDNILSSHASCPRMEELLAKVSNEPEILALINKYKWVFDYLTNYTGQEITDLWGVDYLYDTLYIETLYNKTLPDWTAKVFPENMSEMRDISFKLSTYTPEMKRLRGGPLVQNILDHFTNFISQKNTYKMLMYSGHDTTLSSFLNTLGMFDPPIAPPYASMIIIEMSSLEGKYMLNFAYRNDSSTDPYNLTLPNCDKYCPLEQFETLTRALRPKNWELECGSLKDPTMLAVTVFSLGIIALLALILIVSVIVACVRRRRNVSANDYKYFTINQS